MGKRERERERDRKRERERERGEEDSGEVVTMLSTKKLTWHVGNGIHQLHSRTLHTQSERERDRDRERDMRLQV